MSQLKKKILGICDSRCPALTLTDVDIPEYVLSLRQQLGVVGSIRGSSGQFWTWNTANSNIRVYDAEYYKIIFLSSLIQNALSRYRLSPKINSFSLRNDFIVVVSELMDEFSFLDPLNFEKQYEVFLSATRAFILRNKKLRNIIGINSGRFRTMLLETLPDVKRTFSISQNLITRFYELVIEITNSETFGHGDLHPGNLLTKRGSVFYTDFESVFSRQNLAHLDLVNFARFNPLYREHVQKKIGKKKFSEIYNSILLINLCVLRHLELRYGQKNLTETQKFLEFI